MSELLHFLALSRKTGKLTLRRRDGSGLFVLRNGRIIYAASSSVREAFGNILVCRGLISEATLAGALERQQWSGENRRLGAVLVDMGQVRQEDVREVVRYQVGCVIAELDQWRDGFFRFDAMDIPEGGEIEVDAQDFVVAEGLNTEHVLLAVATELDGRGGEGGRDPSDLGPAPAPEAGEPADALEKKALSLPGIVEELPTLVLHGEITQRILRRASHILNRGVLFIVRHDASVGIGHFGLPAERALGLRPEMLRLLGPFRSLELALAEAGLQIEKDMLDGRTKSLERARRSLGP